jgi:DNA repair protein RecN (Recombination protein N)
MVDLDDVPTLVFDEVDAGIGGRAATAVGRRLSRLGARRQVIVVTHLPQIASFADRHVRVEKRRGTATVQVLDDRGRVEELSRMLSGLPESVSASVHAEELLAQAHRARSDR